MTQEQPLTVGRIVHVYTSAGLARPAIVTHVYGVDVCNLRVFRDGYDGPNDPPDFLTSVMHAEQDDDRTPNRWHWPPRVE